MGGLRFGVGILLADVIFHVLYKDSTNFRDAHRWGRELQDFASNT
jgi:hypothetical protein